MMRAVASIIAAAGLSLAGASPVLGQDAPPGERTSIPPDRLFRPGTPSPVTFEASRYGEGLRRGEPIPDGATVTRQMFTRRLRHLQGIGINIAPPAEGQFIVSAVAQIASKWGNPYETYDGTFEPEPNENLLVLGQTTESDAGLLLNVPRSQRIRKGSTVRVYALFRRGAEPSEP